MRQLDVGHTGASTSIGSPSRSQSRAWRLHSSRAMELLKMLPAVPKDESLFALSAPSRDAPCRKARDRSQIPDATFHDTRHEAIDRLAKKLQSLDFVRMTRHKSISELMTYHNVTGTDIAGRLD